MNQLLERKPLSEILLSGFFLVQSYFVRNPSKIEETHWVQASPVHLNN